MKLRSILLAVIVLAALSAVAYLVRRPDPIAVSDARLGKPLVDSAVLEKAAKLQISDQGKSVTLVRSGDGQWRVSSYHDLPADFSKLTRFTNDLVEAKLQRLVTTNPDRISRLEFKDTRIELKDAADQELWAATLGKTAETGGRFVRFGTEAKAYLATLSAWLDTEPKNWADAALLTLKPDDVARVELSFADSTVVTAARSKKEDPWKAEPAPADHVLNAEKITSLLSSLSSLRFSDTTEPTDPKVVAANTHQRTVKLTTFDGKTVSVTFSRTPEEKKLKPPSVTADGNSGPGTLGSLGDLASKADGKPAQSVPAEPKPITPEYETIPAGPVFVSVTSSDPNAPLNALMHKRAFQVSEYVFTGLPQNSSELFSAAPAAPASASSPTPAEPPAPKS